MDAVEFASLEEMVNKRLDRSEDKIDSPWQAMNKGFEIVKYRIDNIQKG